MRLQDAIHKLESAGRYIVLSRDLESELEHLSAIDGARSSNPDLNALAVIAVAMCRVVGASNDDNWDGQVCELLGIA